MGRDPNMPRDLGSLWCHVYPSPRYPARLGDTRVAGIPVPSEAATLTHSLEPLEGAMLRTGVAAWRRCRPRGDPAAPNKPWEDLLGTSGWLLPPPKSLRDHPDKTAEAATWVYPGPRYNRVAVIFGYDAEYVRDTRVPARIRSLDRGVMRLRDEKPGNQVANHLQPRSRPEPEIVDVCLGRGLDDRKEPVQRS